MDVAVWLTMCVRIVRITVISGTTTDIDINVIISRNTGTIEVDSIVPVFLDIITLY